MLSISKSEFNVIGFLIRQFSKRFTIRSIASKLGISSAGMHAVLKKLEKGGIVKAERLGTGLFYEINLESRVAQYLAAVMLLRYSDIKKINVSELEKESKAVIFDGKTIVVVTSDGDAVKDICYKELKEIKVVCKGEEEFVDALRNKEISVLDVLEQGNVLFGEELIVDSIKKVMR